jgi:GNAT superfamily N-acetyltransferase
VTAPLAVVRFDLAHAPRVEAFFEAASSACFCRYWHFGGDKNGWLERCAVEPETNARELRDARARGSSEADALIALGPAGDVVGWLKLAPRDDLPKLGRLPVYRGRDLGDPQGVFVVGCVLVHPDHRRRGVARALIAAAIEHARALGARAIEAYPRRATTELAPEQAWMGPFDAYRELGFVVLPHPEESEGETSYPYPVVRRMLEPSK